MNLFLTIATVYLICAGAAALYARQNPPHAGLFTIAANVQLEMAAVFYVFGIAHTFAPSFWWVVGAVVVLVLMATRTYPRVYGEMNDEPNEEVNK